MVVQLQNLQKQLLSGQPVSTPQAGKQLHSGSVGVLLDDRIQERWVLESLAQALAVPGTELAAVAIHRRSGLTAHRARDCTGCWIASIDGCAAVVNRCSRASTWSPPCNARCRWKWRCMIGDDGWQLDDAGATGAAQCGRGCVAVLSPRPRPVVPLPGVARRGVWGVEIGERLPASNRWAGATEICARSAVTIAQLVDYARPGFKALYRACGATVANSARRNRLLTLRTAMSFFRRQLVQLTRAGDWRHGCPARAARSCPRNIRNARRRRCWRRRDWAGGCCARRAPTAGTRSAGATSGASATTSPTKTPGWRNAPNSCINWCDLVNGTPFEVDITSFAKYGAANEIAVRITDPNGNFDWRDSQNLCGENIAPIPNHGFGGITGKVTLLTTEKVYIEDVFVKTNRK